MGDILGRRCGRHRTVGVNLAAGHCPVRAVALGGRPVKELSRRAFLIGSVLAGAGAVTACSEPGPSGVPVSASDPAIRDLEAERQRPGQQVVNARLSPRPVEVDLGGLVVSTWVFADTVPGPVLRARAGDLLQVEVDNQLDQETSVHWHGIALRNDM